MWLLLPIAFVSGILTVFSPCVLPILPIILSSGLDGNKRRVQGVIVGLVISFTLASLLLASIVSLLGLSADFIRELAVFLLVIFGLSLLIPKLWEVVQAHIEKHWKLKLVKSNNSGFVGGLVTGFSLGVVWSPCIGPLVAAVASLAAVGSWSLDSALIVFVYALGTAVPLYAIAFGGASLSSRLGVFKTNNQQLRQVFGLIILATAMFIYTGADRTLQAWTLDNLPESWTLQVTKFEERFTSQEVLNNID